MLICNEFLPCFVFSAGFRFMLIFYLGFIHMWAQSQKHTNISRSFLDRQKQCRGGEGTVSKRQWTRGDGEDMGGDKHKLRYFLYGHQHDHLVRLYPTQYLAATAITKFLP